MAAGGGERRQAVVSRGANSFNAFGTMLLSQDVGQSLFVSVKLEDVGASKGGSGELRVIARRVFLDKLPMLAAPGPALAAPGHALTAHGRATVDAKLVLHEGRIHDGSWQVSARELLLPGEDRFDHFTVNGKLSRASNDFVLEFTDLPKTISGKIRRVQLRDAEAESLSSGEHRPDSYCEADLPELKS